MQIDNLFKGIEYQSDVIQNKLTEIDAWIKKIDKELKALTKPNKATEVSDAADNEISCIECTFSCTKTCDMKKHIKDIHVKFIRKECTVCWKGFLN